MKEKITEKRVLKGYKIKDSIYKKAMKRAKKENHSLSTWIETIVSSYAKGDKVELVSVLPQTGIKSIEYLS